MSALSYTRALPLRYDVDVLVLGGGPAGCAAAWAAAKSGAKTVLIEGQSCLGGLGTAGMVSVFLGLSDGENFLGGAFLSALMRRMNGGEDYDPHGDCNCTTNTERLKRAYEDMLKEAGAEFVFQTQLTAVEAKDGMIDYCVLAGKSGIYAAKAKVYIDGTGDADVAAWAGVPYDMGDDKGGVMGGTLCSIWTGMDWSKRQGFDDQFIQKAFDDGVFDTLDKHLPGMFKLSCLQAMANLGHTFGMDATNDVSLTAGLVRGRELLNQFQRFYNGYVPGFEKAEMVASAALMGVRETRIIRGAYKLVLDDFLNRAVFDDEIGRFNYRVDIHSSDKSEEGYKLYFDEYMRYQYKAGESYGIPYRVMLPEGCDNLLVAGRCVSSDRHIQSSIRVMTGCAMLGQAAGLAAAQCAANGTAPADADVRAVQKTLKSWDVYLPNY